MGAGKVILTGTRDSRLEMGRELGADHTINVREQDAVAAILGLTDGRGVDLSIECSGAGEAPQQCVQVTKRGGKILFVAFYTEPVRLDLNAVVRNDVNMYTSRGEGGNNVKRAIALAAAGKLQGKTLVTHRFPLQDISDGLRVLRERIGEPLKVVFVP
jgi:L-iditol 2-dehydrogenase